MTVKPKIGKLYRVKDGYGMDIMRPSTTTFANTNIRPGNYYKTVGGNSVMLFLKERQTPGVFNGTGKDAFQLKELFFLYEGTVWSITENMAKLLEEVVR